MVQYTVMAPMQGAAEQLGRGIAIVSPGGDAIILRRMRLRTDKALKRIGVPNNL
jgi:hypothetical protein